MYVPVATLPLGNSISVKGSDAQVKGFKIVLPYFGLSLFTTAGGITFTDVVLPPAIVGVNTVVMGSAFLSSSLSLADQNYGQLFSVNNSVGLSTLARSVSVIRDFNGDGFKDLIIGDPYAAKCYVLFGSSNGLTDMTTGFTIFGESDSDLAGWSVSDAGDVNNDTIHDIIIGAPNAKGVGAFYVIYGNSTTFVDVYLSELTTDQGISVFGKVRGDAVGVSVSGAGDINKDGYDDVVVGAVMTRLYNAGAAFIVYGGSTIQSEGSIEVIGESTGLSLLGSSFAVCGYSVSGAGDVNNDGFDDVLVGCAPQSSSVVPMAYLFYGSTVSVDKIILSSLTTKQGVVLIGGGLSVSGLGDVNHDGHDDIMITSGVSAKSGIVIYTHLDFAGFPSYQPSHTPTVAPTRFVKISPQPSVLPTLKPSVCPTTVRPSVTPSVRPSSPTFEPTVGATEPTSTPSMAPTQPTCVPSAAPVIPTVQPSEVPSIVPSVQPTEPPSQAPSILPTAIPSMVPTVVRTVTDKTARPSVLLRTTRAPTIYPTQPTSKPTNLPDVTVIYINEIGYYARNQEQNFAFVVNASADTNITGQGGADAFIILPKPNTQVTIKYFNLSGDVIVLAAFAQYRTISDLNITRGSVIITLVNHQIVRLVNVLPENMTEAHFKFAEKLIQESKKSLPDVSVLYLALPLSSLGIVFLMFKMQKWYQEKYQVDQSIASLKGFIQEHEHDEDLSPKLSNKLQDSRRLLSRLRPGHERKLLVVVTDERLLSIATNLEQMMKELHDEPSECPSSLLHSAQSIRSTCSTAVPINPKENSLEYISSNPVQLAAASDLASDFELSSSNLSDMSHPESEGADLEIGDERSRICIVDKIASPDMGSVNSVQSSEDVSSINDSSSCSVVLSSDSEQNWV